MPRKFDPPQVLTLTARTSHWRRDARGRLHCRIQHGAAELPAVGCAIAVQGEVPNRPTRMTVRLLRLRGRTTWHLLNAHRVGQG